ncbi:MAG TPA: zinc metallopeptidase [Verrucomicrobiales bacterium]|nr:zinc metallopeptidase [Verrucomicrobiales bacterium]
MPFPNYDPIYLLIIGVAMIASRLAGAQLQRKFALYSQVPMPVSGRQVAQQMLAENGIRDVEVTSTRGQLTDHYNPRGRTVNLSEPVYAAHSVAAAAVAAHECGHAVQHARNYPMLGLRSNLVPVVQLGSQLAPWVLIAGLGLAVAGNNLTVLLIGIILFASTTLFALITLPVEFDASRRALAWLEKSGVATGLSHKQAKDALFWAAMTYTIAALASLGQLFYYIMLFLQVRNRR